MSSDNRTTRLGTRLRWISVAPALMALLVLSMSQVQAEPVVPEVEVQVVTFEMYWYESRRELQLALKTKGGCSNCGGTSGISLCKDTDEGRHCIVMAIRPTKVDDKYTKWLGHEVLHGFFGRYHEEWYNE